MEIKTSCGRLIQVECFGEVQLVGDGKIEGYIRHTVKFGMDFIEVFVPDYTFVSADKKRGFRSAGLFSHNAIYSIKIPDYTPEETIVDKICRKLGI